MYMKKLQSTKLNNFFNNFAFKTNISFILAWNSCFFTIASFDLVKNYIANEENLFYFNFTSQIILSLMSVVYMTYFSDILRLIFI